MALSFTIALKSKRWQDSDPGQEQVCTKMAEHPSPPSLNIKLKAFAMR